jgi:hypothetical protein
MRVVYLTMETSQTKFTSAAEMYLHASWYHCPFEAAE